MHTCRLVKLAPLFVFLCSCSGEQEPYRKETAPVTGQVVVDGKPPSSPIQIVCHNRNGMDQEHPSVSSCVTDATGKFALSTYEAGDGVPPGDYALTFAWKQFNMVSMSYGGPDKLNGRYSNPQKSPVTFTVNAGDPIDLGRIELTTK